MFFIIKDFDAEVRIKKKWSAKNYPFDEMEINSAFFYAEDIKILRDAVSKYNKKTGKKLSVRKGKMKMGETVHGVLGWINAQLHSPRRQQSVFLNMP